MNTSTHAASKPFRFFRFFLRFCVATWRAMDKLIARVHRLNVQNPDGSEWGRNIDTDDIAVDGKHQPHEHFRRRETWGVLYMFCSWGVLLSMHTSYSRYFCIVANTDWIGGCVHGVHFAGRGNIVCAGPDGIHIIEHTGKSTQRLCTCTCNFPNH